MMRMDRTTLKLDCRNALGSHQLLLDLLDQDDRIQQPLLLKLGVIGPKKHL